VGLMTVVLGKPKAGGSGGRVFPRVSFPIDPFPRKRTPLAEIAIQNGRRL
jgi:hypothetical protein